MVVRGSGDGVSAKNGQIVFWWSHIPSFPCGFDSIINKQKEEKKEEDADLGGGMDMFGGTLKNLQNN